MKHKIVVEIFKKKKLVRVIVDPNTNGARKHGMRVPERVDAWKILAILDSLDEAGRRAVAAVFLSTPETGADSSFHQELRRRGYAKPEGEA